jgi:glycerol transport system substrate-binding protein
MEEGSCNPGRRLGDARRRHQRPGSVYADPQMGRVAAQIRASGRGDSTSTSRCPALAQGNVAQQIFWYTAFTADMVKPEERGQQHRRRQAQSAWRMAPSPHGPYWKEA